MTIGQRIAQQRKEQGLSQEALGETLGVSRQSIYKWESDSALPEIDKLIALSRLFGVSVGWLLGVEADPAPETVPPPEADGELTEAQLHMVEEIVGRYIAAQPEPRPRRRWPFVLAGIVLFFALFNLFDGLDQMQEQYGYLQNAVNNVQYNMSSQINSISQRVEEVLKAQNGLTADYDTELIRRDPAENTVAFSLRAVPKTYTQGMSAVFLADWGEGPAEFPAELGPGQTFTGEITVEMTDNINLSVVFLTPEGARQTQLLDNYSGLYAESMPEVHINGNLMWMDLAKPDTLVFGEDSHERYVWTFGNDLAAIAAAQIGPDGEALSGPTEIETVRVGLFKNQKLVAWAEPCPQPDSFQGFEDCTFYQLPTLEIPLTATDTVQIAALVEDVYGRLAVCPDTPYCMDPAEQELTHPSDVMTLDSDIANWSFD